jgi:hypothetical protein
LHAHAHARGRAAVDNQGVCERNAGSGLLHQIKWASNCISLLLLDTLDQIRRRARATKDLELELGHARASSAAMTYDL